MAAARARAGLRSPPGGRCRGGHGDSGGGRQTRRWVGSVCVRGPRCWGSLYRVRVLPNRPITIGWRRAARQPVWTSRGAPVVFGHDGRDRNAMTLPGPTCSGGGGRLYVIATRRVYDVWARVYVGPCMTCGRTCQGVSRGMRATLEFGLRRRDSPCGCRGESDFTFFGGHG